MSWIASKWIMIPEPEGGLEPVTICRVRGSKGIRFAIRQADACFSKDGVWEFEPIPSNRTEEWLDRFRFDTWEEAANAVECFIKQACDVFKEYLRKTQ